MLKIQNKTAIVYRNQHLSYSALSQHIHCYSEAFKQYDHHKKIIIFGENSFDWIFALYASFKNEAIAIPIDIQSSASEIKHIISDSQPDILFTSTSKRSFLEKIISEMQLHIPILCKEDIDTNNISETPISDFIPVNKEATALIIYTSGTTGSAKGVMLSYNNIIFNMNAVSKDIPIFTQERNTMVLLPLHHIFPLLGSLIAPLYTGQTIYIADGLNSEAILHTLKEGKINLIIGVPKLYDTLVKGVMEKINARFLTKIIFKLANLLQSRRFSKFIFKEVHHKFGGHLEYLVSGGAALPLKTEKTFKTLGFYMLNGYGMTETSPMISFTHPGKWKLGYAGLPLKGTEVKSVEGEICVKGPHVMQGYYNRPDETAQIIRNGWLHTGDLGVVDKKGLLLTGRLKDIIVTPNGKNITPDELETGIVKTSPYVKEAGVFMHEGVLQVLIFPNMEQVRTKSVNELPELIKQTILEFNAQVSPYKRIKRHHIISEELPKTRLGKVQRFRLKDYINVKKNNIQDDTAKNYSEEYILLKEFVDKETGYYANENDHFEIDLSMDSLARVSLMAFIENTFGLTLNEESLNELNTLALLSQHIEQSNSSLTHNKSTSWKEILSAKLPSFKIPKSGLIHQGINNLSKIVFNMVYRFRGRGETNIPDEACIIVANHQSSLDGLFIMSKMKHKAYKNTYFFAKEKHWKSKLMKFMARKNNVILMDINKNLKETLQKLSHVLKEGKNVIIFPEGTRSKHGLKEFKDTFAILSKTLNIPVVPVVIYGSNKAAYSQIKIPRYLTPVRVEFLPPVFPSENDTYQSLKMKVQQLIEEKVQAYNLKKKQ